MRNAGCLWVCRSLSLPLFIERWAFSIYVHGGWKCLDEAKVWCKLFGVFIKELWRTHRGLCGISKGLVWLINAGLFCPAFFVSEKNSWFSKRASSARMHKQICAHTTTDVVARRNLWECLRILGPLIGQLQWQISGNWCTHIHETNTAAHTSVKHHASLPHSPGKHPYALASTQQSPSEWRKSSRACKERGTIGKGKYRCFRSCFLKLLVWSQNQSRL